MSTTNIKLHTTLPCSPDVAYHAWLDSKIHGEMVDGDAKIDPTIGGRFSIWGDAIVGKTVSLEPGTYHIVQDWRYELKGWPQSHMSRLEISFTPFKNDQTMLGLIQTGIPDDLVEEIVKGWKDYYFTPMQKYFSKESE